MKHIKEFIFKEPAEKKKSKTIDENLIKSLNTNFIFKLKFLKTSSTQIRIEGNNKCFLSNPFRI